MAEFSRNPFQLLMRAREEAGEIVEFRLLNQDVVLLSGPEGNEAFFRAPDDQVCRREAYKVMTPIFGKGVVFDAPVERMNEQLQMIMPLLRDQIMRSYPPIIARESEQLVSRWGATGVVDLLEAMKELTLYASCHCLIGEEFRRGMTDEFAKTYHDIERGVQPLAYFFPNLPIPAFRRRDAARARLQAMIEEYMSQREGRGKKDDGLQRLLEVKYSDGTSPTAHEVTGILIALMLAGHHTSAGTAVWIILELLRNPQYMAPVMAEIDEKLAGDAPLSYPMLREMTFLGAVIKEVLRLHPPLIFLFRKVLRDFQYKGFTIPAGKFLCASPAVSHRIAEIFPDPHRFDPGRYAEDPPQDQNPFAWIAFGGGKHKCSGNAFGVLQLKAISATLLHQYQFELADPADCYRDDYSKATVQPKGPCRLRYSRRAPTLVVARPSVAASRSKVSRSKNRLKVSIDYGLCQGHAVCVSEAPQIFRLGSDGKLEVLESLPAIELNDRLEKASKFCPNRAIRLEPVP
jgi:sterol 14-demethylase